jgi:hypothetical protein
LSYSPGETIYAIVYIPGMNKVAQLAAGINASTFTIAPQFIYYEDSACSTQPILTPYDNNCLVGDSYGDYYTGGVSLSGVTSYASYLGPGSAGCQPATGYFDLVNPAGVYTAVPVPVSSIPFKLPLVGPLVIQTP